MIFKGIIRCSYLLSRLYNMRNVAAFTVLTYYDCYPARLVQPSCIVLFKLHLKKKCHRSKPQQTLECFSETFKLLHLTTFQILYEVP